MANDWTPLDGRIGEITMAAVVSDTVERWYTLHAATSSRTSAPGIGNTVYYRLFAQRVRIHDIRIITQTNPGTITVKTYLNLSGTATDSTTVSTASWGSYYAGYKAFDNWVIEVPDDGAQFAFSMQMSSNPNIVTAVLRYEHLTTWRDRQ